MSAKPTILFICQHNAGRSQLGAGLLEHLAGDRYTATSAGLSPADQVNDAVAATLAELGVTPQFTPANASPARTLH